MDLDIFDGAVWRQNPRPRSEAVGSELAENIVSRRTWTQQIDVTLRNLESDTFVTAGIATAVRGEPSYPLGGGIFAAPDGIGKGDTYSADVYTPRPSDRQLRDASTDYEDWLRFYRTVILPPPPDSDFPPTIMTWPGFDDAGAPEAERFDEVPFDQALERARLDRIYALAQELKAGTETPFEYMEAIEAHLGGDYGYSETAAGGRAHARRLPLRRQARLLPAVLGRGGAAAADGRGARAGGHRLHVRLLRRGRAGVRGARPRRALLGGGLVPRATAGCSATRRRRWRRRAASRGRGAAGSTPSGFPRAPDLGGERLSQLDEGRAAADDGRDWTVWIVGGGVVAVLLAGGAVLELRRRRRAPAARAAADGGVRARAAPRALRAGRGAHAHADGAALRRLAGRGGVHPRAARAALLRRHGARADGRAAPRAAGGARAGRGRAARVVGAAATVPVDERQRQRHGGWVGRRVGGGVNVGRPRRSAPLPTLASRRQANVGPALVARGLPTLTPAFDPLTHPAGVDVRPPQLNARVDRADRVRTDDDAHEHLRRRCVDHRHCHPIGRDLARAPDGP